MVTGTNTNVVAASGIGSGPVAANSSVESPSTTRRPNDNRRSNKPIMEKRRRARINNCLNELKTLILDAMKKDPARHSKLEKADILEMTVKHLQNLQRQQAAMSAASDPSVIGKFRAGFSECAGEVGRFPGLDPTVKRRLLQHLANVLNQGRPEAPQVQVHILPNPAGAEQPAPSNPPAPQSNSIILSNGNGTSLHLVPTRLPNGDIALVLPTAPSVAPASSPLPLLVPIPTRTASNASASSASSGCSSVNSAEPMETQSVRYASPPMQKPLSLVVKKCQQEPQDDEKPWRPW